MIGEINSDLNLARENVVGSDPAIIPYMVATRQFITLQGIIVTGSLSRQLSVCEV